MFGRKKKQRERGPQPSQTIIDELINANYHAETDPLGSYTGKPADPYEVPVQDADDL